MLMGQNVNNDVILKSAYKQWQFWIVRQGTRKQTSQPDIIVLIESWKASFYVFLALGPSFVKLSYELFN